MLADPLVIDTDYITAADIPAVSREPNKSVYKLLVANTTYTVTISHTTAKGRRRTIVRSDAALVSADPYNTGSYLDNTTTAYLVIDRSERLVTDANVVAHVKELLGGVLKLCTFANTDTTRIAQIVAGES